MLPAVLVVIGIAAIGGMLFWMYRAAKNQVALGQRDAALQLEQEAVDAKEAVAAQERAARTEEFHEKKSAVRSADDAADLLRDVTGAGPRTHP